MAKTRNHDNVADANAERDRQFKVIGEFVFEYSQLEYYIKDVLSTALKLKPNQVDLVTAPYDFIALCNVTAKILIQIYPDKQREIENIFNACRQLNEERVRTVHGLWFESTKGVVARHVSRNSLKPNFLLVEPISRLNAEAQRLRVKLYNVLQTDPRSDEAKPVQMLSIELGYGVTRQKKHPERKT